VSRDAPVSTGKSAPGGESGPCHSFSGSLVFCGFVCGRNRGKTGGVITFCSLALRFVLTFFVLFAQVPLSMAALAGLSLSILLFILISVGQLGGTGVVAGLWLGR